MCQGTLIGGVAAGVVALGAVAASDWGKGVTVEEETTVAHVEGSSLRVRTDDGSVSIERDEDGHEVRIVAVKRGSSDKALEKISLRTGRAADGALEVHASTAPTGFNEWVSCSFKIYVPSVSGVDVFTEDGSIAIKGLSGVAHLRTEDGSVAVSGHDGSVSIETEDGSVAVKSAQGDVSISTEDGSVAVAGADGQVRVQTEDGSISVEGAKQSVAARTGDGSVAVSFDADAPGPMHIETEDGSVAVSIGPAFRGVILASADDGTAMFTSGGKTTTKKDGEILEIEFGQSGEQSMVHSGDGSVVIKLVGGEH